VCHTLLQDAKLYELLFKVDLDLAAEARAVGCCYCGGVLHSARYPRKVGDAGAPLGDNYEWRLSFCCAEEGCRRRTTPASVRFLGRKIYLGAVVVLASAMLQGPIPTRMARLSELLGISGRTLRRWQIWWALAFARSPFWRLSRGRFARPVKDSELPHSLLTRFAGTTRDGLIATLRFLGPITTGSARGAMAF
jgi:hypothetical protein